MSSTPAPKRSKNRSSNSENGRPIQRYTQRKTRDQAVQPSVSLLDEIALVRNLIANVFEESSHESDRTEMLIKVLNAISLATNRLSNLMLANQQLNQQLNQGEDAEGVINKAFEDLLKEVKHGGGKVEL